MASFRFECNNKQSKNGKYVILLCVTINGKRKRTKTNIEINSPSQFNAKCKGDNWIRANVPESKKWNQQLHDIIEKAKINYIEVKKDSAVSPEVVIKKLNENEELPSFLEFAEKRIKEILDSGGIRNWKIHNNFLNKLKKYLKKIKKRDLLFAELSPEFISNFDNYLHSLRNEREPERHLHQNTIQAILKKFRSLVLRAIEMGYLTYDKNPFLLFRSSGVKTQKEKLDVSELESLLALKIEEGTPLWHCRNYFFFSFYCAGIRVSDLIQLRWYNTTNEGRLNYQMGKTHKVRDFILVEQAKSILKLYAREGCKATDYIFPLLESSKPYAKAITQTEKDTLPLELRKQLYNDISAKTALINKYLKKLAKMAGIEKRLSMHISRHSFARLAKIEGTDNSILQSLLAHSSVAITEGYMGQFDTSITDEALQNIFNKNFSKSDKRAKLRDLLEEISEEELSEILANMKKRDPIVI